MAELTHYALLLGLAGLLVCLWRIGTALRAHVALKALTTLDRLGERYFTLDPEHDQRAPLERLIRATTRQYDRVSARGLERDVRREGEPQEPATTAEPEPKPGQEPLEVR